MDLFGNKTTNEEALEIIYSGSTFTEGKILLNSLNLELQSLEALLNDTVDLLIKNGKLDERFKEFDIYITIDRGSLREKIRVVFKNPTAQVVAVGLIAQLLNTTYAHFLETKTEQPTQFEQEIRSIESNQNYKNNLQNLLSPLSNNDDVFIINDGEINITINYEQKETLDSNLQELDEEDANLKNGEFREELIGVIRKLDLDAARNNYLGFNIDGGQSRISTSIRGEFHLNDYKELIDKPVKIQAMVRYKDDRIIHIEILDYESLDTQSEISFGD